MSKILFQLDQIKTDCLYFRGDIPCKPHKETGAHCSDCSSYTKINKRILIIKLGAIGDVIRTTPLLRRIRKEFPGSKVTWLTLTPAILPPNEIEEILPFELRSILYIQRTQFDIAMNLDKDKEACALMNDVKADTKFGYVLKDGVPFPCNELALHKFRTGIYDDVSKANTKSYLEEVFEIAGWKFEGEEYLFENYENAGFAWNFDKTKKHIGLNTGCGDRWTSRLWSDNKWVELIKLIQSKGYQPVLLGGKQEHEKNLELSQRSGAMYPGHFSLQQFINLVNQMDLVVTQVTMAMHISVALRKKMVLMNNIFNPHEFYLYERGTILAPDKKCECFYRGTCKNGLSCMEDLPAVKVFDAVTKLIEG